MISIIVPVYKVEKYIRKCIDSILSQTYKDWELILVDDGSPDNCPQICDEYANKDSRIHVFHQSNAGPGKARNKGIEESCGEWITFVDSDDCIAPDYLINFYNNINANSNLIMQGFKQIDLNGNKLCEPTTFLGNTYSGLNFLEEAIIKDNVVKYTRTFGKLYKKDVIKFNKLQFSDKIWFHEDHLFLLEYLIHAQGITTIKGDMYLYQVDNSNISLSRRNISYDEALHIYSFISKAYKRLIEKFKIKDKNILDELYYTGITGSILLLISSIYLNSCHKKNFIETKGIAISNKDNFICKTLKEYFFNFLLIYCPANFSHCILTIIYKCKLLF